MKKLYELELTRHGVTPAQFLAYVRQMCKRHGIPFEMSARDFANGQPWGNDVYSDTHYTGGTPETRPCFAETCKAKPYDHQTYFKGFDGSVYNEIIEFQFDDEKTGFGYFFTVSTEGENPEDAAAVMRSAVNVHEIAIDRNEHAIAKRSAELAETLRNIENGWADEVRAKLHADWLKCIINDAKRENEDHRAAIEEARAELAKLEAPAEAEQTEAETNNSVAVWIAEERRVTVKLTEKGVDDVTSIFKTLESALAWAAGTVAGRLHRSAADFEAVPEQIAPGLWEIRVNEL